MIKFMREMLAAMKFFIKLSFELADYRTENNENQFAGRPDFITYSKQLRNIFVQLQN